MQWHADIDPPARRGELIVAQPDAAAMVFDNAVHDCEAKPHTVLSRRHIRFEQALAIYALPKYGARRTAATPLREFGEDPESKGAVTIKTGQFGPYVTDTFVNATVPSDDNIEDMTAERAFELLAIRREKLGLEPGQAPAKTSRSKKAAPARTVKRGTTRKKK